MIAQSPSVNAFGDKRAAQRMHFDQGSQVCGIAKIIGILATGQRWTGGGFYSNNFDIAIALSVKR